MSKRIETQILVAIKCLTYNHEPFIRQCLDGFIMQQTNFRFVAIVHDDASTDGTADIIREYAEKYPEIIKPIYEVENQYSKKDGSIRRIMDESVEHTGCKYIAICEGDDCWIDSLKLQKQVDLLEKYNDYSMCCTGYIADDGIKQTKITKNRLYTFDLLEWSKKWIAMPLTTMYRRSILDEYYLKANNYKFIRDTHLYYHILKKGKGIYLPDITSIYHLHMGGVCSMILPEINAVHAYNIQKEIYQLNGDEASRVLYVRSVAGLLRHSEDVEYKKILTNEVLPICKLKEKVRIMYYRLCPYRLLELISSIYRMRFDNNK